MDSMKTEVENNIAKKFFIDYSNTTNVSKELYPYALFKKNHRSVSRYFSIWNKAGYLENKRISKSKINKKGKKYSQLITTYRLKLDFYLDYAKERLGKENFNYVEKKILNYIFSFKDIREIICQYDNLIEGITAFLERIFLSRSNSEFDEILGLQFIKGFFVRNKRFMKKCEDLEKQFEEFWKVSIKYADDLLYKINLLTKFDDKKYQKIMFESPISKYYNLPFVIDKGTTEKGKEELLKRFSIVFYEDRKPNITPWGTS